MKKEDDTLESLPNIGSVTAIKLEAIGIISRRDLIKRDPYNNFEELRERIDPNLRRCVLASVVGAHKGCSLAQDHQGERKGI